MKGLEKAYLMNLKLQDYKHFLAILVIGLILTFIYYQIENSHRHQLETEKFNQLVNDRFIEIENKLEYSFSALKSLNAFFKSRIFVNRDEFKEFSDTLLQERPEIQALEWIPIVPLDERESYEERAINDGFTNFSILEYDENNQLISAKVRAEYFPVYYIEPLEGNKIALGYDLGSNDVWFNSLKQATGQNVIIVTPPVTLEPEKENQQAIFAFYPFYRKPITVHNNQQQTPVIYGYAMMVLRMDDFYQYFISPSFHDPSIKIAIKDKLSDQWLASEQEVKNGDRNYHFQESLFNVGGRQWQLSASAPYNFHEKSNNIGVNLTLVLGIFSSLILAVYIHTLKQKHLFTDKQVKIHSKQLVESKACYKAVLDTAADGIISINDSGIISHFNHGAENIFGYCAEEVIGQNVSMLMLEELALNHDKYIANYLSTEIKMAVSNSREVLSRHKDGRLIPIHLTLSDTGLEGELRFTGIIRDLSGIKVTEKKLRQQQDHLEQVVKKRTVALEKAINRLKILSEIDPLTQIANRRVYEHRLTEEITAARRSRQPLALMMIDIDYFKKYNDNYGHKAGDIALMRVAETITETLPRKTDLVARIGGEEFVVLMPATNCQGAYLVAEHIRTNIKALKIKHQYSIAADVITLSIGLSSLQDKKLRDIDLFNQADLALYVAKDKGRNRCVIYKPKAKESVSC